MSVLLYVLNVRFDTRNVLANTSDFVCVPIVFIQLLFHGFEPLVEPDFPLSGDEPLTKHGTQSRDDGYKDCHIQINLTVPSDLDVAHDQLGPGGEGVDGGSICIVRAVRSFTLHKN